MHHWRSKLWNAWPWIKWSPILLASLLLIFAHVVPDFEDTNILGFVWLFISVGSVTFMALLTRRTGRLVSVVERDLGETKASDDKAQTQALQDELTHTISLHSNTQQILIIHILFLCVGLSIVMPYLPEQLRGDVARVGLMTGQYMLFLIAMRSYLAIILAWQSTDYRKERL